jgi:uncharacterized protein (DUF4415 family)
MSSKKNSTIGAKPAVQPNIEAWIGGQNADDADVSSANAAPEASQPEDKTAGQPEGKAARQPDNKTVEQQATTMLSARIPAALMRKLRIHAATEERQIQEVITEVLRDYLGKE